MTEELGRAPSLTGPAIGGMFGLRVVESAHLIIGPFEDWSQVRSPSRAKRRRRQGHPQRIRFYYKPSPNVLKTADGTVYAHPATAAELYRKLAQQGGSR